MDAIRKGLAVVFAVLFITSALTALLLFNVEQKAFSPETYQRAFANENFYDRLPVIMAEALTSPAQQSTLPLSMHSLTVTNWENFIRELMPPETLKEVGDQALNSIFAYLNDETDQAVISLTPMKSRMASEAGTQAVMDLMKTQPDCTLEEIARITMALLNEQDLSLCNPPADAEPFVRPIIAGQLQIAVATMPNEITIASVDTATAARDPRKQLKLIRLVLRLSPILPLVFLFSMTLLAVRGLRDWLAWWGIPFLATGGMASIMAWLGAPLASLVLLRLLVVKAPAFLPSILLDSVSQLAASIIDQVLKPLGLEGLLLMVIGAVMTALAFAAHQYLQPKTPTAPMQ